MKPTLLTRIADHTIVPGLASFTKLGYRIRSRRWNEQTFDMAGRTVVVTGATSGIGRAAAAALAAVGADVVLVGRNAAKAEECRAEIEASAPGSTVRTEIADLSLMSSVRSLADRLLASDSGIHVLINNAGAMFRERDVTTEGIERTLATNLLSHFLLTNSLIDRLRSSAPARVINVSSGGMYTQGVSLRNLQYQHGTYDGVRAYARTKRAQVILTEMWAERLRAHGVVVNAMHPGWADTPTLERSMPAFYRATRPFLRSASQGADTVVWLAASQAAGSLTGGFFLDRAPHPTNVFRGTDLDAGDRDDLWEQLSRLSSQALAAEPEL